MKYIFRLLLVIGVFSACTSMYDKKKIEDRYKTEIDEWKKSRIESLRSRTGWLNICGLYWLDEGINSFGSDSSNKIIFPEAAPSFCGKIILKNDSVSIISEPSANITFNGKAVTEMELKNDLSGNPTLLESGRYAWFIIKRGDRYGIRLRDYENPRIEMLSSIPSYETSMKWLITADFVPFDTLRKVNVNTVTGDVESYDAPGKIIFKAGRKKCELIPFIEENRFFIIFGDKTNGSETYGAGRFMYAKTPDKRNEVLLDFNKAYNPPCAFTPFATCPRPPAENLLEIKIEAGEKEVHLE